MRNGFGYLRENVDAVKNLEKYLSWLLTFDIADKFESYQVTDNFPLTNETHIVLTY